MLMFSIILIFTKFFFQKNVCKLMVKLNNLFVLRTRHKYQMNALILVLIFPLQSGHGKFSSRIRSLHLLQNTAWPQSKIQLDSGTSIQILQFNVPSVCLFLCSVSSYFKLFSVFS